MAVESSTALSPTQLSSWPVSSNRFSVTGDLLPPAQTTQQKDEQFMALARERFKICDDAEAKRRREFQTDLEFFLGYQWDPAIRSTRERGDTPRPCLTINRMPEFVEHVVNNMRQARPGIKVRPVGDTDKADADIRQGLIRHIEVNSQADMAYDTSFSNMAIMGLGWMRIVDDWAAHNSFDKELFVRWIPNTMSVYSDPDVKMPDWSDMQYAFVVNDMPVSEFKSRWPEAEASDVNNFKSLGDSSRYWYPDGQIRVAEYFRIEYEDDVLVELSDGRTLYFSELPEGPLPTGIGITQKRKSKRPQVCWSLITGLEKLEERKWKGNEIPLIPVIGNLKILDGETVIEGMIRHAREPQRMFNYAYSCFVETIALAPRAQWVAAFGQTEDFMDLYQRANTEPIATLPYKPVQTENGQLLPPPQRISASVDLAAFAQALQVADQQMKAIFRIYDASLGQRGPQESGLAINARKIESDTGTFNWGDNFIRALGSVGRKLENLLPYYYNTPGRILQIDRPDGTLMSVIVNSDQNKDPQTGLPRVFDLSKGRYSVVISTGPSEQTRRESTRNGIIEISKVVPQIWQVGADILVKELDWPGAEMLSDRLKKILPPQVQEPDPNGPNVPQLQGQVQQLQQMIQILTQELQKATDKKEVETIKQTWETLRAQMNDETQLAIANVKAMTEQGQLVVKNAMGELEHFRGIMEHFLTAQGLALQAQQPQPAQPATPGSVPGQ